MKAFTTGFLVYLLAVGCQSDKIGPTEGLYKTWESQQSTAPPATTVHPIVLTFRQNSQLAYGVNQQEAGCCQPTHFRQSDNQLAFTEASGPGREKCALVFCAPSALVTNSPWTIEALNANELSISSNNQRVTFRSR